MLLTTEPTISGQRYTVLRILFGAGFRRGRQDPAYLLDLAVGDALAALELKAHQVDAHAVIGVHVSTSVIEPGISGFFGATVMGTAIKFEDERQQEEKRQDEPFL